MTADERIEKLLNRFGQTISDLPKASDYKYNRKMIKTIISAEKCLDDWYNPDHSYDLYQYASLAYICHLCDVIDRMEIALETAFTQLEYDCDKCSTYDCQGGNCQDFFRLRDKFLIAPELEIDYAD